MGTTTIKFIRSHNLDYQASYGIYHGLESNGSDMALIGSWKPLWPEREKIGLGLGTLGYGLLGGSSLQSTFDYGLGYGYLGTGHFGIAEKIIEEEISDLENGTHYFQFRLKSSTGIIGTAITPTMSIIIAEPPDAPMFLTLSAVDGQTITLTWS